MPEYLAPGVYVEVRSDQSQVIEGVSTTTTGFIGPCAFGPIEGEPVLVTSLQDYESIYGSSEALEFAVNETADFMSHAVKLFFENGGKRLLITRVFEPRPDQDIEEAMACRELLLLLSLQAKILSWFSSILANVFALFVMAKLLECK